MEKTFTKTHNGNVYYLTVIEIDGTLFWKATHFSGDEDVARELQSKCGYPVKKYGFGYFGKTFHTAYWECYVND